MWYPQFNNVSHNKTGKHISVYDVFDFEDCIWNGSEQLFQCCKHLYTNEFDDYKLIYCGYSDYISYCNGRQIKMSPDHLEWWDANKDDVMCICLFLKFHADDDLEELLLSTKNEPLICIKKDLYWGTDIQGTGKNKLAKILEYVRYHLFRTEEILQQLEDEKLSSLNSGIVMEDFDKKWDELIYYIDTIIKELYKKVLLNLKKFKLNKMLEKKIKLIC